MQVVSLNASEMSVFVDFLLDPEREECDRVFSDEGMLRDLAVKRELEPSCCFVAKGNDGVWIGAAHWTLLGPRTAKVSHLFYASHEDRSQQILLSLLGRIMHEIMQYSAVEYVVTCSRQLRMVSFCKEALQECGFKQSLEMQEWSLYVPMLRVAGAQSQLISERLILEPMRRSHAPLCFGLFQDARIYRYIAREPPLNVDDFSDGFSKIERGFSPDFSELWWNWVGFCQITQRIVTTVEISLIRKSKEAYLAYTTFPSEWNKGFAKEACRTVIDFLFRTDKVRRVIIEMDIRNKASIALAESLGATRIAFLEKVQMLHGEWSNEYRYEIVKDFGD